MSIQKITVEVSVEADKNKVWDYYTKPEHITKWNFADPSWHCPSASNDLKVGGVYVARMEAKDGNFGFDFEAVYLEVQDEECFVYEFGGRKAAVQLKSQGVQTALSIAFDPETENPLELQQEGWQAILNNFKKYVEAN
jgi:uncharacterized protein YndB with AHSA1/START domain